MTWTCPSCGRAYPDSGIGVPRGVTAGEKEGCVVCWVCPVGISGFRPPEDDE